MKPLIEKAINDKKEFTDSMKSAFAREIYDLRFDIFNKIGTNLENECNLCQDHKNLSNLTEEVINLIIQKLELE